MEALGIELVAKVDKAVAQVKTGVDKVGGFVTNLNKKKVNWTEMLTAELDPATIVGEIGALFSTAVLATAEFQSAQQLASANSTTAFSNMSSSMTADAFRIASKVGASASDTVSALGLTAKAFDNNQSMMDSVTEAAAQFSSEGLGSVVDIAGKLSDVLRQFGVTDGPTATKMMNELRFAAKNSGLSFDDFVSTIISTAPTLKRNFDFTEIIATLSQFSTQSGLTASQAIQAFDSIASNLDRNLTPAATALLGSLDGGKVAAALKQGDLAGVLANVETGFQKGGIAAAQLGLQAGLSGQIIGLMGNVSQLAIKNFTTGVDTIKPKLEAMGTTINKGPLTQTAALSKEWNSFIADIDAKLQPFGDHILKSFTSVISDMHTAIDTATSSLSEGFLKIIGASTSGETAKFIAQQQAQQQLENSARTSLSKPDLGLSGSAVSRIVATESTSGTLQQLINALGGLGSRNDVSNVYSTLNLGTLNVGQNATSKDMASELVKALKNSMYNK